MNPKGFLRIQMLYSSHSRLNILGKRDKFALLKESWILHLRKKKWRLLRLYLARIAFQFIGNEEGGNECC